MARVKKTETYQQTCDEIFIVADIKRVLSNDSVKQILKDVGASNPNPSLNMSLVCTHADVYLSHL